VAENSEKDAFVGSRLFKIIEFVTNRTGMQLPIIG